LRARAPRVARIMTPRRAKAPRMGKIKMQRARVPRALS